MDGFLVSRPIQRVAATLGVLASIALAYFYILYPALTVPYPAAYGFYVAWAVIVLLSLAWWNRHPWRSFVTPIAALAAVLAALWFGGEYLGWGP